MHRLPELLAERKATGRSQVDISFPEIEKFDHLPLARTEGVTAFVSIMEGCSKYCSFCVVPYTRGEEVSRPLSDVLTEIAILVDQGIKEVNLLGQNVNAYQGVMDEGDIADFALLLEYIHDMPGIERIRYTTSHPREFTTRLIETYAKLPKLVSHLHLPIQSGSDRVLAAMKRGYSVIEYKSIIRRLRAIRPELSLSSDFIIGFPGETEADFEATMKLIEDLNYDESFSFVYSQRPGTPAADLPDDTPADVKLKDYISCKQELKAQAQAISQKMVGTMQRVLIEGYSKRNAEELRGRTDNFRVVNFAADPSLIGCFVDIKITETRANTLRGELID